jgi:hemerythrin-like domain-containing protein
MQSLHLILAAEHGTLKQLFAQFQNCLHTDGPRALPPLQEFAEALARHFRNEELLLFPVFERKIRVTMLGPTPLLRAEHWRIAERVDELRDNVARNAPNSEAAASALNDALTEHFDKEELVFYPALDHMLTQDEQLEVTGAMTGVER